MTIYCQDIVDQALEIVEMSQDYSTSGFAERNAVQRWFNQAAGRLHYDIANADNTWWNEEVTIPVTAGTARYGLPNGTLYSSAKPFYKMNHLLVVENGRVYSVPKFQRHEIDGWSSTGPRESATLKMQYTPAYEPAALGIWSVSTPALSTQYPPGFEDYVAMFIARRLSIKEEKFERAQALIMEMAEAKQRALDNAAVRDQARPESVQDTSGRWAVKVWELETVDVLKSGFAYRLFGDYLELGQPQVR
jgi:hypothetical protein